MTRPVADTEDVQPVYQHQFSVVDRGLVAALCEQDVLLQLYKKTLDLQAKSHQAA